MGRVDGKVAFITGAARGQGRSHALRLAAEGADIIAVDMCGQIDTVLYPLSTPEDLAETVRSVEGLDRRIVATVADVRDYETLARAVAEGVSQLGRLDIVVANAGILSGYNATWELTEAEWNDTVDVDLTGVWHSAKAAIPYLIEAGHGGSIVLTSSAAGLIALPGCAHYTAAKHGVVGLMKTLALELAPHMIRVNAVNPTSVNTPMIQNSSSYSVFAPDLADPGREDVLDRFQEFNAMPIPWVEPLDISNAVLFLASDEARYITGVALPVDAGCVIK